MAQPLYELLTGLEGDSLNWNERQQQAFEELKLAITSTSALGLPDLAKLFTLYVTEEDKVAMGLLSQTMWMWDRPVASLKTAAQCCHWVGGVLMGSCCGCLTGPGGDQADFGPRLDHKSSP